MHANLFQEMLCSTNTACRIRVFDLILNLGVHAQLLEPKISVNASTIEEEYAQETFIDNENRLLLQGTRTRDLPKMSSTSSAIENFESWILKILFEILLVLVQVSYAFLSSLFDVKKTEFFWILYLQNCFRRLRKRKNPFGHLLSAACYILSVIEGK